MSPRKEKNSRGFVALLTLLVWLATGVLSSFPAHAVGIKDDMPTLVNPYDGQICPVEEYNNPNDQQANRYKYGIIKRMVFCVQQLVIPATYKMLYQFSIDYLYSTISIVCTLAVALWGVLMVVGKNSAPVRDAFTVALKIGSVSFFTYALGKSTVWPDGLFPVMLDVMQWLATIVTNYIGFSSSMKCAAHFAADDVFGRVDCALNSLIGGIFDPRALVVGLAGFFLASLFSGGFGFFIALAGFAIITFVITGIIRATYIFISAYIALALMCIISPVFITMILFQSTYGYFEKWLKLTVGFMLQPLFLFAYMSMLLIAYDTVMYDGKYSIYRAIVPKEYIGEYPNPIKPYPDNTEQNPDGEFYIGWWLMDMGIYQTNDTRAMGVGTNPRQDAFVQERNTGIGGGMAVRETTPGNFDQRDSGGVDLSVLDNFKGFGVFKVSVPFKQVAWQWLAIMHECGTGDCHASDRAAAIKGNKCGQKKCTEEELLRLNDDLLNIMIDYLIQLFLSVLIALLTMYIFYIMIDHLPYIGQGIGGEKESLPVLGADKMGMPGEKIMNKVKSQIAKMGTGK